MERVQFSRQPYDITVLYVSMREPLKCVSEVSIPGYRTMNKSTKHRRHVSTWNTCSITLVDYTMTLITPFTRCFEEL